MSDCPNFSSFRCGVRYELTVPAGIRIDGHSSGGGITVLNTSGLVTVSSSGGGISTADTTGELVLNSSGGGITVERSSGRVTVDSSGGGIDLVDSRSDHVNASSSGGGVTLSFAEPPGVVNASSSGGGVRVDPASHQRGLRGGRRLQWRRYRGRRRGRHPVRADDQGPLLWRRRLTDTNLPNPDDTGVAQGNP